MATKKATQAEQAPQEPTGDAPEPQTATDASPDPEAQEDTALALPVNAAAEAQAPEAAADPDWTPDELDRAREIMAAAGFGDPALEIPIDLLMTVRAGGPPEEAVPVLESDPIAEEEQGERRAIYFRWRTELGITRPDDEMRDRSADEIAKMGQAEREALIASPFYETTWAD